MGVFLELDVLGSPVLKHWLPQQHVENLQESNYKYGRSRQIKAKLTPLLKIGSLDMIWVAVADLARPTRARHARARISSASVRGV